MPFNFICTLDGCFACPRKISKSFFNDCLENLPILRYILKNNLKVVWQNEDSSFANMADYWYLLLYPFLLKLCDIIFGEPILSVETVDTDFIYSCLAYQEKQLFSLCLPQQSPCKQNIHLNWNWKKSSELGHVSKYEML